MGVLQYKFDGEERQNKIGEFITDIMNMFLGFDRTYEESNVEVFLQEVKLPLKHLNLYDHIFDHENQLVCETDDMMSTDDAENIKQVIITECNKLKNGEYE